MQLVFTSQYKATAVEVYEQCTASLCKLEIT